MLDDINLMSGLTQKMGYLQTRQRVVSENISNTNTPGFKAHDVKAPDFATTLGQAKATMGGPLGMAATNSGHMNFLSANKLKSETSRNTYEITPEGNTTTIEEQMMKSSQTAIDYQLMTNLYNKNMDMLRMSIRN